jgi:dihydropyrimidine dehydrogenase (NAD+) subunit PreA
MPCIVKLTPNVTSILPPAMAANKGGADAVSLINTIKSITNVDLDAFSPFPMIDGKGSHGGYCGPAVKPIALNMVAEIARHEETRGLPISGIGGVTTSRHSELCGMATSEPEPCHQGGDQSGRLHQMWSLLCGLRRHQPSGDCDVRGSRVHRQGR